MEYLTPDAIKKLASASNVAEIAERVLALQTSDKFRLAAALLDVGRPDLAEVVGMRACQEIQLAQLFGKSKASE